MDRERASAMQNTILYYAAIMSLKEELDDFKQAASGSSL
jgi:flagellar basal body rod protein FlgB